VAAGVLETVVHAVDGDDDLITQVVVRAAVYALVGGLIWGWWRGARWTGWLLLVGLGIFGLGSLVSEPLGWWAAGNDPMTYLVSTGWSGWAVVVLRAVHVLAVISGTVTTALALMSRRGKARPTNHGHVARRTGHEA
jgi:hypothetical protein